MKKVYTKPLISVEAMNLDQPITAANCSANKDDIQILIDFGYFMADAPVTCSDTPYTDGDRVDSDGDGDLDAHDTICYHSNIQTAFLS